MSFKVISIAALMVAGLTANAAAADIPARMPVKATPNMVVAYNWGGFYTASTLGAGRQDIDSRFVAGGIANTDGTHGWSGSHVGYQVMSGNWVLGIEGGYTTPLSGKFDTSIGGTADCTGAGFQCHSRIRSIWSGGGKVGYANGNWMVYGAGGYANARIEDSITAPTGVGLTGSKANHGGWYAGAGVDWYVTRIWHSDLILGVEYRHYDFSNTTHNDPALAGSQINVNADVDMVMAKATFKWVGMGPLTPFVGR